MHETAGPRHKIGHGSSLTTSIPESAKTRVIYQVGSYYHS